MHDIKEIVTNKQFYIDNLNKRAFDTTIISKLLDLNEKRKTLTTFVETTQADIKKLSKEIGALMKSGKNEDAQNIKSQVSNLKSEIEKQQVDLANTKKELDRKLSEIPNLLEDDTPIGTDESSNVEVSKFGSPKEFSFAVKDHVEVGESLGLLDFNKAADITGARFCVYKGALARLERALANFMLDFHLERGYTEVIPPYIVNEESLYGTGQLPKFEEDLFKIQSEDKNWYLIPTAEVPLTNLKRGEIFSKSEFPLKYVAYTPCFRSEAGSHGRDTRGLIRMHQFHKVEMVNIVSPEQSNQALEEMTNSASDILKALNLPHRIVRLCSGDIGFGARKTYDLEVWVPSQQKYREISSCSNCGDFQARRASIRFKEEGAKPQFAHTLNGSGLAVGRTFVAVLENYQQENGSIKIPEVLIPYMGGLTTISK